MKRSVLLGVVLSSFIGLVTVESDAASVAVIAPLAPNLGQFPESITADDAGNVYLSMSNIVWKVNPDGQHQPAPFAQLPIPAGSFSMGLKVGPDGNIYAASAAFDPGADASHVWQISPSGAVAEYAHFDARGFPNDLCFDDDGNLYVTDSTFGIIYKIDDEGAASIWLDDPHLKGNSVNPLFVLRPFGSDGIVFDKHYRELYVGNLDYGQIFRIPIGDDGEPGAVSTFASDPRLLGVDGLAFDKHGNLYGAANVLNQIAKIDPQGNISIVAQGGPLDGPSSLVFGTNGHDKKTLYISSFAIGEALGLVPGVPRPSLDSIQVPVGGLPLP